MPRKFTDEIEKQICEDYLTEMSIKDILDKYQCTMYNLQMARKRQNVKAYPIAYKKYIIHQNKYPPLTQDQIEFLNGNLLGDGNLSQKDSETQNSGFRISQRSDRIEYVKWLENLYYPFSSKLTEGIK